MELYLAPTVVESSVPERTRRRGEYDTSVWKEDNGLLFLPSPLKHREQTKPEFFLGGLPIFSSQGGGKRGIGAASFFFLFFFLLLPKADSVFSQWFALRSRRKDDGRRGRSEGATEAESRLFDAIIKREEAHDQLAKPLRHLHAPGKAPG